MYEKILKIGVTSGRSLSVALTLFGVLLTAQAGHAASLTGIVEVAWGDSDNGSDIAYTLVPDNGGSRVRLELKFVDLTKAGGVAEIGGKNVTVEYTRAVTPPPGSVSESVIPVIDLQVNNNSRQTANQAITQAKFVSLMCKFNDVPDEPNDLTYFNDMYGNQPGYLDHYWQEVSSNEITVNGSYAVGWYTLPYPRSHYVTGTGFYDADLTALWQDCTAAADADVDFTEVLGINMMFNDLLDCCAWGGGRYETLDGVTKFWPSTWNPPWAAANVAVIKHEMGHAFGLPHSNNADNDTSPYDNPWTVMSDTYDYSFYEPTLGYWGKHLNSYEKNRLNLFGTSETYTGTANETTIRLDPINNFAAGSGNYRFAYVPAAGVGGIDYYTVEVRANGSAGGVYDVNLPASAVIIHSVDTSRNEPAWLVDNGNPPSDEGDGPGVQWLPGEEFEDAANNVKITIDGQFGNSFDVTIGYDSGVDECNGEAVTVNLNNGEVSTNGDDVILGTPGDDVIYGRGGDDIICGMNGIDTIYGGPGSDTIFGGDDTGNDDTYNTVLGGTGDDFLYGGPYDDYLYGQGGADYLETNNTLSGLGDIMVGGSGNDTLSSNSNAGTDMRGNGNNDTLFGSEVADIMRGDPGLDTIYGYGGDDEINGGIGADMLYGGDDDDQIYGADSRDDLFGEAGDDFLYGGLGNDDLDGGTGNDFCNGQGQTGGAGDTAIDCESSTGIPRVAPVVLSHRNGRVILTDEQIRIIDRCNRSIERCLGR